MRAKRSWVPLIRILRALTGEGSEFYTNNIKRGGTDFVRALAYPSAQRQKAKVGRLESGPREALCARQEKPTAPKQSTAGAKFFEGDTKASAPIKCAAQCFGARGNV